MYSLYRSIANYAHLSIPYLYRFNIATISIICEEYEYDKWLNFS